MAMKLKDAWVWSAESVCVWYRPYDKIWERMHVMAGVSLRATVGGKTANIFPLSRPVWGPWTLYFARRDKSGLLFGVFTS